MDELLELDFTLDPTLTIYEASRDLMRARRAEWHDEYTLPSLWDFFRPSREAHGSYWFDWTTRGRDRLEEELPDVDALPQRVQEPRRPGHHRLGLRLHLQALRLRLHPRARAAAGGRLPPAGGDPRRDPARRRGRSAWTTRSVRCEPGKLADLVVVDENPLANLKVLYGTGAIQLERRQRAGRGSAASATRSRTASSTTPSSSWPTSGRWSRRQRRRPGTFCDSPGLAWARSRGTEDRRSTAEGGQPPFLYEKGTVPVRGPEKDGGAIGVGVVSGRDPRGPSPTGPRGDAAEPRRSRGGPKPGRPPRRATR